MMIDHPTAERAGDDRSRIGIIGAGRIGRSLAVRFTRAGHEVMVSNSRGPETLHHVASTIDGDIRAGTVAEAAAFGTIVAIAVPVQAMTSLPPDPFRNRIVIDVTNYYPEPGDRVPALDTDAVTSSQMLAFHLPGATVVKAFNTIYFGRLLDDHHPDWPLRDRLAVPLAGDDAAAKATVSELIEQVGFAPVDAGVLAETRAQQPGSPLYRAFADSRARGTILTPDDVAALLSTPKARS
jgi:8-hydroxy-5-deazaflavin:NADPH oxidoreductase